MSCRLPALCLALALACCSSSGALAARDLRAQPSPPGRRLQQTGNCTADIPGCDVDRCAPSEVPGLTDLSICQRCAPTYVWSAYQLQCICEPGFFENATTSSCEPCGKGAYCPGGNPNAQTASDARGPRTLCGAGLTTRTSKAVRYTQCVTLPGYYLSVVTESAQAALPCGPGFFSEGNTRMRSCKRCAAGFAEDPAFTSQAASNASMRATKEAVCMLPPGKFLVGALVRDCAMGYYSSSFRSPTASNASTCSACPRGVTTTRPGAMTQEECTVLLAGFVFSASGFAPQSNIPLNVTAQTTTVAYATADAVQCGWGTFSSGGMVNASSPSPSSCQACPNGFTTQKQGAVSREDCMAPPGYFSNGTALRPCGNVNGSGYYREDWAPVVSARGDGSDVCSPCGPGILTGFQDVDETPATLAAEANSATKTMVSSTSGSCYIDPGQGIVADVTSSSSLRAIDCPDGTYGVAARVYGLAIAPCKPCARNMVTSGNRSSSAQACYNPAGFGYSQLTGATQCSVGYYAANGSMAACQACPFGRTTTNVSTAQQTATDCFVAAGYGIYSTQLASPPTTDAWSFAIPGGSSNATIASLAVAQCPVGFFGAGGSLSSRCTRCPTGSTTADVGSTSAAQCNVCQPGFGFNSTGACAKCPYGTFQAGGSGTCAPCPTTVFPDLGTVNGTTFYTGTARADLCVPRAVQADIDVGQLYGLSKLAGTTSTTEANAAACARRCSALGQCCFAQFSKDTGLCQITALDPANETYMGTQLFFKMPPTGNVGAAGSKIATQGSGLYAHCQLDTNSANAIGYDYVGSLKTWLSQLSEQQCKDACDKLGSCWGFSYKPMGTDRCLLRTGKDDPNALSFFSTPEPVAANLEAYAWA